MLNEIGNIKIPGAVLRVEIIDDNIYILDNKFRLFIYSNETFTLKDTYFLLESQNDKHIYEKSLAISKNLDFYNSFSKSCSGAIFNIENDEVVQSLPIELNKRNVYYAKFSQDSKTLLIGGEDGVAYFYSLDLKKSLFSLEPRSDFISSASFSHTDKLVSIGAYDKAIKIYNIDKHTLIAEVEVSDTVEDLVFLDDDSGVIGITRDRKIFSYNIKDKELIFADIVFDEWPTSIVRVGFNHILVGTKGDILYIFKIDELMLLRKFRVDNFGVKALNVHGDNLYIGYSSGELKIIDMNFSYQEFRLNLKTNKYAKATSLMKTNIFLMTKEIVKKYDTIWAQVLDMAKEIIAAKDVERAEKLAKPFFWDKKKKEEFMFLQANIADFKHFEELVEKGNQVLAFKFADEKKHLQDTKSYQVIESDFYKVYQVAKGLFAKESNESIQKAKEILLPYLSIESKKKMINNLILNHKTFVRSSKLVKVRNFKVYFKLVSNNDFLKNEALYSKIVEIGNQTYSNLLEVEQEGDYDKALQIADYLEDFTPFTDKAIDVKEIIESKINLQELITNDDIRAIYDRVSEFNYLELSSIFTDYHKKFELQKDKAMEFANSGNSAKVKETLNEHLGIEYLLNSIAMIFKFSYLVEIELAMTQSPDSVDIRLTLERYSSLFGVDSELTQLAEKLQFSQLLPDSTSDTSGYKTNKFYDQIVVIN